MTATRTRTFAVRRRAIEMLIPHLPEDDLFRLDHILEDGSLVPIQIFLAELFCRDARRAEEFLRHRDWYSFKVAVVLTRLPGFKNAEILGHVVARSLGPIGLEISYETSFLHRVIVIAPYEDSTLALVEKRASVKRKVPARYKRYYESYENRIQKLVEQVEMIREARPSANRNG